MVEWCSRMQSWVLLDNIMLKRHSKLHKTRKIAWISSKLFWRDCVRAAVVVAAMEWKVLKSLRVKKYRSRLLLDFGAAFALVCLHYLFFVSTDTLLIFLLFHGSLKKPMSLVLCVVGVCESGISWISTFTSCSPPVVSSWGIQLNVLSISQGLKCFFFS